jgi:hypothetical protein
MVRWINNKLLPSCDTHASSDNEIVANRLYHVNEAVNHASGGDIYATTPAVTDDINYTNNYG